MPLKEEDIIKQRIVNQQLAQKKFSKPEEVIGYFGAMQAQEYNQTLWSIGQRLLKPTKEAIEKSFNDGKIIRTHILRPTWHFVKAEDLLWMLSISSPRVNAFNAYYYRKENLDEKTFKKCNSIIENAFKNERFVARNTLKEELAKNKIEAQTVRLASIFMKAELDGLICSGPRIGKQFTYALVSERIPNPIILPKDEALARLVSIYFQSRGPATLQDFAWWSGLTITETKRGLEMLKGNFIHEKYNGTEYILSPTSQELKKLPSFLMSTYEEYGISYKNRSALFNPDNDTKGQSYMNYFVVEGKIGGAWKKETKGSKVSVEVIPFRKLNKIEEQALNKAVTEYLEFENQKS